MKHFKHLIKINDIFIIEKNTNRVSNIDEKSFIALGFKERENLQEWIVNNSTFFGEELLIIQKKFDGFNWMRNLNTIEYLGIWETLYNPDFKPIEFDRFRTEVGLNALTLSPQK